MLELVVHALPHISFAILLCEHAGCIFCSFEDIHLLFWLFGFIFFCQVDGQECLRTSSSYLCFSRLKLYSCYITKFDQVRFEPLCVRSTQSPRFVIDINFQNFFVCFGLTDSSISVIPRSLSWSRFSISVQLIRTFWSHRVAVTVNSYASRCHRVSQFGPTEIGKLCVMVRSCVEAIYTPPPPLHSWREPSEQTYTSNLLFLRENYLLMCWGQDIPFLPYESWSLAFPKLLSTQIFFPPNPNPMRESWVLGRLSFEAQEQGVHHQHTICYFLESGVS